MPRTPKPRPIIELSKDTQNLVIEQARKMYHGSNSSYSEPQWDAWLRKLERDQGHAHCQ